MIQIQVMLLYVMAQWALYKFAFNTKSSLQHYLEAQVELTPIPSTSIF